MNALVIPRRACAAFAGVMLLQPITSAAPPAHERLCLGARVTMVGTPGSDRIVGTDGIDVIAGRGGDDVILGGDGRDRICGGDGDDELDGRYGDDQASGGTGHDRLRGGPGDDLLVGGDDGDALWGGDGRADRDTLVGGSDSDSLHGGDGRDDADHLFGGGGGDAIDGGLGGRDVIYGGPGDDYLYGGLVSFELADAPIVVTLTIPEAHPHAVGEGEDFIGEPDGIVGSPYEDLIIDGDAGRTLHGGAGADRIDAGAGDDRVDGGPGGDDLDGGEGRDSVSFADSDAAVIASLAGGEAEGAGSDSIAAFEDLEGSFFDDRLTGDDASNTLYGSFGRNAVFGLAGDDTIRSAVDGDAGEGHDSCEMTGVAGCEQFTIVEVPLIPFVASPLQREHLDRLEAIRGGLDGGFGGPDEERLVVAVRRTTQGGCWWWSSAGRAFVRGLCGVTRGTEVPIRDRRWSLRVDTDLPSGIYEVRAIWREDRRDLDACWGVFAPMCVRLDDVR